jgi:hypothetical protein
MRVIRWLLLLPFVVLMTMLGSLVGGLIATPFEQNAVDGSRAFFGTFAFIWAAALKAPTSRRKVTTVAASFVFFLALIGAVLSFFNVTEEYAARPGAQKIIIPIAQFLGSLYGWTIVGAIVTENATLEFLWREINGLGTTTCLIGLLILIVGVVLGSLGVGWITVGAGASVLSLGALTIAFPFFHLRLRMKKAEALMDQYIRDLADRKTDEVSE